jgi:hypothetical protein
MQRQGEAHPALRELPPRRAARAKWLSEKEILLKIKVKHFCNRGCENRCFNPGVITPSPLRQAPDMRFLRRASGPSRHRQAPHRSHRPPEVLLPRRDAQAFGAVGEPCGVRWPVRPIPIIPESRSARRASARRESCAILPETHREARFSLRRLCIMCKIPSLRPGDALCEKRAILPETHREARFSLRGRCIMCKMPTLQSGDALREKRAILPETRRKARFALRGGLHNVQNSLPPTRRCAPRKRAILPETRRSRSQRAIRVRGLFAWPRRGRAV